MPINKELSELLGNFSKDEKEEWENVLSILEDDKDIPTQTQPSRLLRRGRKPPSNFTSLPLRQSSPARAPASPILSVNADEKRHMLPTPKATKSITKSKSAKRKLDIEEEEHSKIKQAKNLKAEPPFTPRKPTTQKILFSLDKDDASIESPSPLALKAARNNTIKTAVAAAENHIKKPNSRALNLSRAAKELQASTKAAHSALIAAKPLPSIEPEIWAEERSALCSTLPYFRAYQGGSYTSDGIAQGFLLDGGAHARDYMDSHTVIFLAGGGKELDPETGVMRQVKDTADGVQARAVQGNIVRMNPVVLIVGAQNAKCAVKVPYAYCVMDWFKPTYVWSEKVGGKIASRYRFEKLIKEKVSWWSPAGFVDSSPLGTLDAPENKLCDTCGQASKRVYTIGWMCLQKNCDKFWMLSKGKQPLDSDLVYDDRFIKEYTPWSNEVEPYPLKPEPLRVSSNLRFGEHVSIAATRGLCCPTCGRCSMRLKWTQWECYNPLCDYVHAVPMPVIPATMIRDPFSPLSSGFAICKDSWRAPVMAEHEFRHNYRIVKYTIPGIDGCVAHMIANRTVVEEKGGPDDMFEELQRVDIGLERRKMENGQVKGGTFTGQFLVNYGMYYKFVAQTATHSFANASDAVLDGRSRLNWATRFLGGDKDLDFNEVLILAYMEAQKIGWHDDGESGLDKRIATLSLGHPGTMGLRMKRSHHTGLTQSGKYHDEPPLPGCLHYSERLALHDEMQSLPPADRAAFKASLPAKLAAMGIKGREQAPAVISMKLNHGDIVVMDSKLLQRCYEHCVVNEGRVRFAITGRWIDGASLKEGERPEYEVEKDERGYDGAALMEIKE